MYLQKRQGKLSFENPYAFLLNKTSLGVCIPLCYKIKMKAKTNQADKIKK